MAATPTGPCRVYVSEHGNVFIREIADHLVEAIVAGGHDAEVVTDELPGSTESDSDPLSQLVLAPHEFFPLFPASEVDRVRAAEHSLSINTEQQGTPFFDTAMHYARHGRLVFDINTHSLAAIRRIGLAAVHLPLGYSASMDRWHGDSGRSRSIDLGLLAGRTPRREAFIAGAGGQLWEWRTDLRFFSWHRPALAGHRTFTSGDEKYERLADTRILLNVHRDHEPYFEWARVVEAVANGCVVATETSVGIEPFVAGTHLVMSSLDDLAEQAIALAFDEPRRVTMATAAYEVLTSRLHQRDLIAAAWSAADHVLATSVPATARGRAAAGLSAGVATSRTVLGTLGRRAVGAISPPPAAPAGHTAERQVLEKVASDLKRSFVAQVASVRTIERSLALLRHGSADHVDITRSAAAATSDAISPEVSVVVPLYNQGQYLRDAIDSVVAAATDPKLPVELIVVDDHSTDGSLAVALELLAERPWLPMVVSARAANGGLPDARNTGFALAHGRLILPLDADNTIYPNALSRLAAHLDAAPDDVVATYGLLERFDERGAVGLTSHLPWDPDLLVHGAYIDAMAMFRADAWRSLGGYVDPGFYGWEDYDLWLTVAERGCAHPSCPPWSADTVNTPVRCARSVTSTWPPTSSPSENGIRDSHGRAEPDARRASRRRRRVPAAGPRRRTRDAARCPHPDHRLARCPPRGDAGRCAAGDDRAGAPAGGRTGPTPSHQGVAIQLDPASLVRPFARRPWLMSRLPVRGR